MLQSTLSMYLIGKELKINDWKLMKRSLLSASVLEILEQCLTQPVRI